MLKDRILATLKFFDLQDLPLTLLELHSFLIANLSQIRPSLDYQYEFSANQAFHKPPTVDISEVLQCLDTQCSEEVASYKGFYFLNGRQDLVNLRLANYLFGLKREKLIRRFTGILRHLPFLRAVAIAGSQAFGQQKATSDIDLFVITDPEFLWLARIFISAYFQITGHRRHGRKIANRFCLNHYLAGPKNLQQHRDLYNAMEYLRLRPLFGFAYFEKFYAENISWLNAYFQNFTIAGAGLEKESKIRKFLEKIFQNSLGRRLNEFLGKWQLWRIKRGEHVVADGTELAFHSLARKRLLLASFFELQKQNNGEAV